MRALMLLTAVLAAGCVSQPSNPQTASSGGAIAASDAQRLALARNLNLTVVAEGVETEETWNHLAELGCPAAQGYYLCRPLTPEALTAWLINRNLACERRQVEEREVEVASPLWAAHPPVDHAAWLERARSRAPHRRKLRRSAGRRFRGYHSAPDEPARAGAFVLR